MSNASQTSLGNYLAYRLKEVGCDRYFCVPGAIPDAVQLINDTPTLWLEQEAC